MRRIIFLPPNISPTEISSFVDKMESGLCEGGETEDVAKVADYAVYINCMFKSPSYIVYEIDYETVNNVENNYAKHCPYSAKQNDTMHNDTFVASIAPRNAHNGGAFSQAIVTSQVHTSAEIRKFYRQLALTPLDSLISGALMNVFGIVLAQGGVMEVAQQSSELRPIKTALISMLDFNTDCNAAVTIQLWRHLACWTKSLTSGDIIQIRDLERINNALRTTSRSQILLLAHGPLALMKPVALRPMLSSHANQLVDSERAIISFLQNQSLYLLQFWKGKSIEGDGDHMIQVMGRLLEIRRNGLIWFVDVCTQDIKKNVMTICFDYIDANIWCLLNELTNVTIGTLLHFVGLAKDFKFNPKTSRLSVGLAEGIPAIPIAFLKTASIESILGDNTMIYGIRLVSQCQLQESAVPLAGPSDNLADYSVINSQTRTWILTSTSSEAYLLLSEPVSTPRAPFTLLCRQKVLDSTSPDIIGRSFIMIG